MVDLKGFLKNKFSHPFIDKLDIDSEQAIGVHRRIIRENSLLKRHYEFIYGYFKKTEITLSDLKYPSLEIGSGGGFLKNYLPDVITSDVVCGEGIDRIEDAAALSFSDNSLKAVYANGVLHHIKNPAACLHEIERVLAPQGKFVCNEPSSSLFGYFMNKHFHNEYTDKYSKGWEIKDSSQGRLTSANMAMPHIIFKRDAGLFRQRFKELKIISIVYHDFLRYTLSGGLSYKPFVPGCLHGCVNFTELLMKPFMPLLSQAMLVTIQKI